MKNKITKCNKWLVSFALVASIAFSGCGGSISSNYCDDKEGQKLYTKLLKEYLLKNEKGLKEYIGKVDFLYEVDWEHSVINEEESKALCYLKNATLKFDTGDSIVLNGALSEGEENFMKGLGLLAGSAELVAASELTHSRFFYAMAYKQDKKTKQTRIEVVAPSLTGSNLLLRGIPEDIIDYYDGTGVPIDGKRKGACPDGVQQTRDKNGEITFEGRCANGTREGAWKYYENGFLAKEEIYNNGLLDKATEYYPLTGMIKSSYTTDSNGNSKKIEYDEGGFIKKIYPYSRNEKGGKVINGKVFNRSRFSCEGEDKKLLLKTDLLCNRGIYAEVSNGKVVLKREYYDEENITGKTEQEVFENIDKAQVFGEVVVLGNLQLRIWYRRPDGLESLTFYKNDEKIGGVSFKSDYYNRRYKEGEGSSGYCTTGQCQVMFKELIDKSFYKDKIYSALEFATPKE